MCGLEFPADENLIVGLDRADDAGVYQVSPDLALIQSVDFFTPIVDDPYWFGQIAVANALSDIYAMGGVPKTAMNLVGFPIQDMDISVLRQMLQGGLHKMQEAQVVLVGGHSVEDSELKYGLSVTGFVHPAEVLTKKNLKPGDKLILTKPLGTGILNTAIKAGLAQQQTIEEASRLMAELNQDAARIMRGYQVQACTDITGFGFLGHLAEMVLDSGMGIRIWSSEIPVLDKALEFAGMGMVPAGAHKNYEFRKGLLQIETEVPMVMRDILFDPQTSGGLLISVQAEQAQELLQDLQANVSADCALVGEVVQGQGEKILLA